MNADAPVVSLLAHPNYEPEATLGAVRRLLAPLGGMGRFVKPGDRVLLKPNLVFGRHPDRAINPHPAVVAAAAVLAREAGAAWVGLGDSPGFGSCHAAAKAAGLLAATRGLGVEPVEFTPTESVDAGRSFVKLELAREILDADVIINLPKMKTHGQMFMTLAVKNMFGAVPGARKLQWHYRAGRDRRFFARAINEIARAVRPHLSILDAVVGMDGLGPSAGTPRQVGFLAAGDDPWAVDAAVMDILGRERQELYTLAAAAEFGPREWMKLRTVGDDPARLRPARWDVPEMHSLQMHGGFIEKHLPRLAEWLRDRISPPPRAASSCTACGYCVDICPAKAMRLEGGAIMIDAAACIRCYCCHELCQYGAMEVPATWFGRLLGKGGRRS